MNEKCSDELEILTSEEAKIREYNISGLRKEILGRMAQGRPYKELWSTYDHLSHYSVEK